MPASSETAVQNASPAAVPANIAGQQGVSVRPPAAVSAVAQPATAAAQPQAPNLPAMQQAAHEVAAPALPDHAEGIPAVPPRLAGPGGLPAPAATAEPRTSVRELLPVLDRAIASGQLGQATPAAAALRSDAARLVHAIQFQQLQNALAPGAPSPADYVRVPLPVASGGGAAELRIYVKGEPGRPRIDPNDVRVHIELRLSRLDRVGVDVHLCAGRLACHFEADNPEAQRLLENSAGELQDSLRGLGFGVDPIRCKLSVPAEPALPAAPLHLGQVNVSA